MGSNPKSSNKSPKGEEFTLHKSVDHTKLKILKAKHRQIVNSKKLISLINDGLVIAIIELWWYELIIILNKKYDCIIPSWIYVKHTCELKWTKYFWIIKRFTLASSKE